ncbi:HET-domain-containing protein [Lentithecium fluviatile CBS 122367]|uniref:HET-domain-containing protein n=1 Tax=Lentithecium fluviatile CBS 122367 TaxID=1168545 RepID=A0A6G1IL23_9PLEO|nr:HET-domain-containing protein [Lentithecium fluviatile CBS 122367]
MTSEALAPLYNLINQDTHTLDERSKQRLQRRVQKLARAARISFAERALLQDQNRFLSEINNEAKARRLTRPVVLGKGKVMSFEELEEARAKRAAKETATAAKGKVKRGRKTKAPVLEPDTGTTLRSEVLEPEAGVLGLETEDRYAQRKSRPPSRLLGQAAAFELAGDPFLPPARLVLCETMRLLQRRNSSEFSLTERFVGNEPVPPYAILSHTWKDGHEVTFKDLMDGTGPKAGYDKIRFCGQQAKRDSLRYFWVDTCCIDKSNAAELQDAINSMFRWYQNAAKCYVYLPDVSIATQTTSDGALEYAWEPAFRQSKWFTRGWTLQELLAPTSVEFFSQDQKKFGDKHSLKQHICAVTGIPDAALEGAPLSQFSNKERFSWIQYRKTKEEEDKAYSLLGIFDVEMPLRYGEGYASACKRLEDEINKLNECVRDLRLTDPRDDKRRIEDAKGGLLKDSYRWILYNSDFRQWRTNPQSRLLWIKGDPGKGKTMLLCGIANELETSIAKTDHLSYFFCQATDSRINNATLVLRGLLYLLVDKQPSLISHIQKKYDPAGKSLFEDANAWVALSQIFTNILQDPRLTKTYLVVDALDECIAGLPKLLEFIIQQSCISHRAKWIVSSRNWPDIEERLDRAGHKVRLCLELNTDSISTAVSKFIQHKTLQLAHKKEYNRETQNAVFDHLSSNANNTFLWVALVCQNLEATPRWEASRSLAKFPPGLDSLYERMMEQICKSDNADLCKRILASVAIVLRPITLKELTSLFEMPEDVSDDPKSLREMVGLCGSFLTIEGDTVYFVHQSAKDFLFAKALNKIFPFGTEEVHYEIFSRSLQVMSKTLQRDMYRLSALGYLAEQIEPLDPDPLAASRYSCIYWIDHLCDWNPSPSAEDKVDLQDRGAVNSFLRQRYLY